MPQEALNRLLSAAAEAAGDREEDFFERIRVQLCDLCADIAAQCHADSAAIFFTTDENRPGELPWMVMRGASGRLLKTFEGSARGSPTDSRRQTWQEWRRAPREPAPDLRGFAYRSELTAEFLNLSPEQRRQAMSRWSVTNQIWHQATGRIANSNRAMDQLQGGQGRQGQGDDLAYSRTNLHSTFRTMVGVPVFAQGSGTESLPFAECETGPVLGSPVGEFLSRYRVVGILKVEGKRPLDKHVPSCDVLRRRFQECLDAQVNPHLDLTGEESSAIDAWWQSLYQTCEAAGSLAPAFEENGQQYSPQLNAAFRDEPGRMGSSLRKAIADVFTAWSHAQFTRQDMDLLVLLAMQIGRVLTRRIIKHAAVKEIVFSENEIGTLNVRWGDIQDLVLLREAAEAAKRKVYYHLRLLKAELDSEERRRVYQAGIGGGFDARGPIWDIQERTKDYVSLIRKLVRKQRLLEGEPDVCDVRFPDFTIRVDGYGPSSGPRCLLGGNFKLFVHQPDLGKGTVDVAGQLGVAGAPQARISGKELVVALDYHRKGIDVRLPLVRRVVDAKAFAVDDLAGVRVITDYDSDLDKVLDELRARADDWGIELVKVDDLREGKQGGYRAVHLTLSVDVGHLIQGSDARDLRAALGLDASVALRVPLEIQLRTAYEHSWARKTHGMSYRRERNIPDDLLNVQEILSNVLRQADWLSDIVRCGVEGMLMPTDWGQRALLEFLARRMPGHDVTVVEFGVECAKQILQDRLRYNGQPEIKFAIEVCERLVHNFGVVDSNMLLLALLRNVWRLERGTASAAQLAPPDGDIIEVLCSHLESRCATTLARFRTRLPLSREERQAPDWLKTWMRQFPSWFWVMQGNFREYFRQPVEDRAAQVSGRLRKIDEDLKKRLQQGEWRQRMDEWFERAYVMEAAVLFANLTELPFEPGSARRARLYNDHLSLFREIRRYLPNGPVKTRVVEELERVLREISGQLDLARNPETLVE